MVALLMIGLSGCADVGEQLGNDASFDDDDAQPHGEAPTDGNGTIAANVTVADIVAVVAITVDGNLTEAVNGTFHIPAGTNITFDANGTQADVFTWSAFNGTAPDNTTANGTVMPSATAEGMQAVFMFTPGNHTVTLQLAGENATGYAEFMLTVADMIAPEPSLVSSTTIAFSRAAETWANGCKAADHAVSFPADTVTQTMHLELDPAWTGVALDIVYRLYVFDAEGAQVAKAARSGGSANLILDAADLSLPGGDYTVRGEICSTFSPQVSFTVKGTADHYA